MLGKADSRRIIILRHAQTTGGKSRAIGHTHLDLSDDGKARAHDFGLKLQARIEQGHTPSLYSSPSQRALESFGLVYKNSPEKITIIPDCQEIFLGDWEGLPFAKIKAQYPDLYEERGANMAMFRPPFKEKFGENFKDVQQRMLQAIRNLAKDQRARPALVISHAGCIRALLCHCLPMPLENIMQIKVDNLQGIVLDCDAAGTLRLVAQSVACMDIDPYL